MKFIPLIFAAVALTPVVSSAFTATFPSGTFTVGAEVAGTDGWTINDAGQGGAGFLSFVTTLNGDTAGAVGGLYNAPAAAAPTDVYLSHAAPSALQYTTFSVDFAIVGSSGVPGRDGFGFSMRDAVDGNLLTISFAPVANVTNDAFQVKYTVGNTTFNAQDGNGDPLIIFQGGEYNLSLAFAATTDPTFSATITGGVNSASFTGVATGLGAAQIASVGAVENTLTGQEGDNYLVFDNLSIIPEASSSLLLGFGALGFLTRRRRA
jgi:hypothetical protein